MPAPRALSHWLLLSTLIALSFGCDNKTALEHLKSAQDSIAGGEPRVAIIELKNAVQKDGSLAEARGLLGQLHLQKGDLASALKELERAIDLGSEDNEVKLSLLRVKNALGRYSEVVGELEEQETLEPAFAVVLANAYLLAGDVDRAKQLLKQGLHLSEGLLAMAYVARSENDVERAYSYLNRLVEQAPSHRDGWLLKGEVELSQLDSATALSSFGTARTLLGGEVSGQLGVIRAHLLSEDLAAAQTEVDNLVARASNYPPAQYLKGLISFKQNDLESAEAALRVVQQHAADHLPTLYLMGAVQAQQGQLNQAINNLQRYLAQDPNNISVRKLLASIYNAQNKTEDVLTTLQPASSQNSDPQLWAMLGAAYLRSGEMTAATEAFERAVSLAPDMAPFRNQLALSLLSAGEDERAMAELSSAVELDEDQFQSDYILVMLKIRDRDFDGAAEAAERLVAKSSDVPIGYNLKGAIALAQKDIAAAKVAFEEALRIEPGYFPAAQNLARIAEQASDFGAAEDYYQAVLAANENNQSATLALVDLAVRQGDAKLGLKLVADAVAKFPKSVRARLGQLRLLVALGRLEQAELAAKEAFELAPNSPDVLALKTEVDLRTGDRSEAQKSVALLQALMGQFKSNKNLLAATGSLHLRLGNLTLARSNLEAATSSDPVAPSALVNLARLELAEGDHAAAQARVDQLVQKGVGGEEVALLQGDTLLAANKIDQAKEHFKSMANEGSRSGTSRYSLVALRLGDNEAAQKILQGWLDNYPEDRGIKIMLANAQIQAGQQNDAKTQYEEMLPTNDPIVLNNLAWIYMSEGNSKSLDMARQANAAAPNNPDIEDTLGWILVNEGAIVEGLELLRSSARLRPDNGSVLYHLGIAYQRSGDAEAARRAFERAISGDEFPELAEAQKALAEL